MQKTHVLRSTEADEILDILRDSEKPNYRIALCKIIATTIVVAACIFIGYRIKQEEFSCTARAQVDLPQHVNHDNHTKALNKRPLYKSS